MRTVLLIALLAAVYVALSVSASAREHRSSLVKHEFQLTHPCPSTGSKITLCRSCAVVLMRPRTCNGKRSGMRRQRINGRRKAALGRSEPIAGLFRSPPYRPAGCHTRSRQAFCASRGPKCPRRIEQPSRRGWARPDDGRLCTTRSAGPGLRRQCPVSLTDRDKVSRRIIGGGDGAVRD